MDALNLRENPPMNLAQFQSHLASLEDTYRALNKAAAHQHQEKAQLVEDLEIHRSALRDRKSQHESDKAALHKQIDALNAEKEAMARELAPLKGLDSRVNCVIDGDGTIFLDSLIARGQEGGREAAATLANRIRDKLSASKDHLDVGPHCPLFVSIFYNKRGLLSAMGGRQLEKHFEEFHNGFSAADERFYFVDVGSGKEAADAKIKVLLEDVRLPQVKLLVFGGTHDNGYCPTLSSLITRGFRSKLCLLDGTGLAEGIAKLDLPVLAIPELFRREKINNTRSPEIAFAAIPSTPPGLSKPITSTSTTNVVTRRESISSKPAATTWSSVAQLSARLDLLDDERSDTASASASDTSEGWERMGRVPKTAVVNSSSRMIEVDRSKPLSQQKPKPPCTKFYLADYCKYDNGTCKYAHNFRLNAEDYEEMQTKSKESPCPLLNMDEACTRGDKCIYGHVCSRGPNCFFKSQRKCKFQGAKMHLSLKV